MTDNSIGPDTARPPAPPCELPTGRTLDDAAITALADELVHAGQTRVPIPRITSRFPQMTIEDSYAVQSLWRQRKEVLGRRTVGHKIGLTSKAMQAATGISEPDYGVILDDMVLDNGTQIAWSQFTHPRVEVELAFVLSRDIAGPGITVFDVLDATEYVVPALEILDSRIEMDNRTIVDTISDNAAMGAMLVGGNPVSPTEIDLRWIGAILYRNETVEETGLAAGVLNNPAAGVSWLANKLATHAEILNRGEIVLSGSFTRPLWVYRGDTVVADYGRLGTLTCRFV